MSWSYDLLIRESHLDTFGHVNNATYLALFEQARWELVTLNGYGLDQIKQTGHAPVILEVTLKFLIELKLRERVRITVEPNGYKAKVGTLKQRILFRDDRVAAEALFTFGLFDLKARKLMTPTPAWLKAIGWPLPS